MNGSEVILFMKETRYSLFVRNLVQDALFFVFILGVLSVYRAAFLVLFRDTLAAGTTWQNIALTGWYGLRIGLKTAGACVLPAFVFGTLVQAVYPKWKGPAFRLGWAWFVLLVLSLLFQARIPYYHEFHNAFSPFMFNTFHDDVGAIVSTSIQEYHAVWHVLAGLVCTAVWCWLCRRWFTWLTDKLSRPLLRVKRPWIAVIVICILLVPFAVFVRKGGSFTFNGSIYWKNAARMEQHLLNEAILDDIQAVYRASRIYKQLRKNSFSVNGKEVHAAAARLLGQTEYAAESLLPLLERRAAGIRGPKPDHIFVIVAETYMMWPLLDKWASIPLADGMRRVLARPDAVLVDRFLPASTGTMFGVTSVLLGIPELNLQVAARPTTQEPLETSLSWQLHTLGGYKTRFFYGGYPSWESIGTFMNNQQIEDSFYAVDFEGKTGVWGVPDRDFLQGVAQWVGKEPSFNLILTSSNHPPYRVDMSREQELPTVEELEKYIPTETADKKLTAARMWHFAYADKYLAEFVEKMLAKYPNSLFIITGDHADRWTLENSPSVYERVAVPLVLVGPLVKNLPRPQQMAGSHMDIAATVLELVLPKGTPYYALGNNIFKRRANTPAFGVAAYHWITPQVMGNTHNSQLETFPGQEVPTPEELDRVRTRVKDIQTVAAWRVLKGLALTE